MYRWLEWQKFGEHNADTIAAVTYRDSVYYFASDVTYGTGTTKDDKLFVRSIKASTPFALEVDTGWKVFPVGGITDKAVGPVVFNGRIHVFAQGRDDHQIYATWTEDGSTWSQWKALPGGGRTPNRVTAVVFDGSIYLFIRGDDCERIWVTSSADGKIWTKWSTPFPALPLLNALPDVEATGLASVCYAVPAAVHEGALYLFVHDDGQGIHVTSTTDGSQWSNWASVGWTGGSGLAATSFSGGLLVFSQGSDGQIYMKGSSDGTKWAEPWSDIGSPSPHHWAGNPFVTGGGPLIDLYVLGTEGIFFRRAVYEVDTPLDY